MLLNVKRSVYSYVGKRLARRHGEMIPQEPSPMEVPSRWVEPHKRARIHLGLYEKDESFLVQRHLDPNMDTVELGCGVGVISSKVCSRLSASAKFVGLEGNPELVEIANRNMNRFHATSDRVIEHAVVAGAYEPGRNRRFFITPGNFHTSSVSEKGAEAIEVVVPELSLSELLRRHDFGDYQLVSDVEGAELEIVLNDSEALVNCRRMIIELHRCEVDGQSFEVQDAAELIKNLGFKQELQRGDVFLFTKD